MVIRKAFTEDTSIDRLIERCLLLGANLKRVKTTDNADKAVMPDAASGLFPGHKHVESFLEALEEDYDEEVSVFILSLPPSDA